jgi:hypothetical protein
VFIPNYLEKNKVYSIDKIELTSTLISFFVVWLYKLGIYALVFIPNYLEKNKVYSIIGKIELINKHIN